MTRPRVALAVSSFWPVEGGAERQLRHIVSDPALNRRFEIRVFTWARDDAAEVTQVDGVAVHRLTAPLHRKAGFGTAVVGALARWRPDLVMSSHAGAATIGAGMYAAAARRPLVVRLPGATATVVPGRPYDGDPLARHTRKWPLLRTILRGSRTTVVVPAEHMRAAIGRADSRIGRRTRVIPNGVEPLPSPLPNPTADVVWYGRDSPIKDPDSLVRLARDSPDLSFVALGSADLPTLPNLVVQGWTDDPVTALAGARVTVMTSRYEGSPNIALQSLAIGRPVAGVANDAMLELRDRWPERVFVAQRGEPGELVAAVRRALSAGVGPATPIPTIADSARLWADLWQQQLAR